MISQANLLWVSSCSCLLELAANFGATSAIPRERGYGGIWENVSRTCINKHLHMCTDDCSCGCLALARWGFGPALWTVLFHHILAASLAYLPLTVCVRLWECVKRRDRARERERERETISGVPDTPAIFRHNLGRCRIGQSRPESDKCSPMAHVALPRDEFTLQSHYNSDTRLLGQQSSIQNTMMASKGSQIWQEP